MTSPISSSINCAISKAWSRSSPKHFPTFHRWPPCQPCETISPSRHHFTLEQKRQIAAIFDTRSRELGSDECLAMKGLIAGGNEHLTRPNEPTVRDLMLVAHWIRIKHYEIAAYQITAALALHLDSVSERDLLSGFLAAEARAVKELEGAAGELFAGASGTFGTLNATRAGS